MPSGHPEPRFDPTPSSSLNTRGARWLHPFAWAVAILFFFSWVFPMAVGLAKDTASFPKWWGPVDVTVAFVLAISSIGLQATVGRMVDKAAEESAYRAYRILTHGILALGVSVMLGRP